MAIIIDLDVVLAQRKMRITLANISILKNNRAKAIRFSTLYKICEVLECQPGDIIKYQGD